MKKITRRITNFFKGLLILKDPEVSLEDRVLQEWPNAEKIDPEIVWLDNSFKDFKENSQTYPEHYFVNVFIVSDILLEDAFKVYGEYLDLRRDTQADKEDELLLAEITGEIKKSHYPTKLHLSKDKHGVTWLHKIVYRKIDGLLIIMSSDWSA